jgi:hypothetical protein
MPPFIASDVLSIYNPDNSSFTDYTDQDLDSYGLSDVLHVLHCSDEDQPEQLPGGDDESVNEDAEGDGSSVAHISTKDSGTSSGRKPGTDNTINAAVDGKATVLM